MSVKIDQAFISAFINASYGLPIAHENQAYSPTAGTAYAELINLPNDTTAFSLANSDETDGLFRVILRYPANTGAIAAKTMADTIISTFKIGTRVTYSGVTATVLNHSKQPGVAEAGWYKLIVSIGYRAFLTRS